MPSPIGHALGGLIAGWTVGGRPGPCFLDRFDHVHAPAPSPTSRHGQWIPLGILGMLPDIDLLFGTHSTYTHSVGAVAVVAILAGLLAWQRPFGEARRRVVLLTMGTAAAAYASHLVLDALGTDTAPPIGIMMWWPLSHAFVKSPWSVFPPVARQVTSLRFWRTTPVTIAVELLILVPILLAVARWRRRAPVA